MGQQQLLLVILVTIVVGIATVVATNIFGSSAEQANQDAVRQDLAQMATSAQGWFIKPDMIGGGGNSFRGITFRDMTFPAATISENGVEASNLNGTYRIATRSDNDVVIEGSPSSFDEDNENVITATVTRSEFIITLSEPRRPIRPIGVIRF